MCVPEHTHTQIVLWNKWNLWCCGIKKLFKRNDCHSYFVFCYRNSSSACTNTSHNMKCISMLLAMIDGQAYECVWVSVASIHVIVKDYRCWFIAVFITKRTTVDCFSTDFLSIEKCLFACLFVCLLLCWLVSIFSPEKRREKFVFQRIKFHAVRKLFGKYGKVREKKFSWQTHCP